ncbi:hypothetical protein BLAHAN_04970, partial [Blautia hansenii DSM 20583]
MICINQGLDSKICRQALSIIIEDLKLQKIFHTLFLGGCFAATDI